MYFSKFSKRTAISVVTLGCGGIKIETIIRKIYFWTVTTYYRMYTRTYARNNIFRLAFKRATTAD